jgi:hypothetical protein
VERPASQLLLSGGENYSDVAFHLHLIPHLFDLAVGADQESATHDSSEGPAHEFLGAPDSVGFEHFVAGIADERKIQLLLGAKCRQRFLGIAAGADDRYS